LPWGEEPAVAASQDFNRRGGDGEKENGDERRQSREADNLVHALFPAIFFGSHPLFSAQNLNFFKGLHRQAGTGDRLANS